MGSYTLCFTGNGSGDFHQRSSTLDRQDFKPINFGSVINSLGTIILLPYKLLEFLSFENWQLPHLVFNSFNIIAFTFFIIVHYLFNGDAGAAGIGRIHGCVGALCTTFLVIPLIAYVSKIFGKKQTFLVTQAISIIGYVLWFLFQPDARTFPCSTVSFLRHWRVIHTDDVDDCGRLRH